MKRALLSIQGMCPAVSFEPISYLKTIDLKKACPLTICVCQIILYTLNILSIIPPEATEGKISLMWKPNIKLTLAIWIMRLVCLTIYVGYWQWYNLSTEHVNLLRGKLLFAFGDEDLFKKKKHENWIEKLNYFYGLVNHNFPLEFPINYSKV